MSVHSLQRPPGSLVHVEQRQVTATVEDNRAEAERVEDHAWIEKALDRFRDRLEWLREH